MNLISVIIPTFNRQQFLKIAIDSVLQQTYSDFELIIIDDGSTDDTQNVIDQFKDKRINYYYQINKGAGSARNYGMKMAKSTYLAFLDSDDKWVSKKLEIQLDIMEKNKDFLLSHTEEVWFKGIRLINHKKIHKKEFGNIFHKSLILCSIGISTVIMQRKVIDLIGYFDDKFEVCEDYDYFLRFTVKYPVYYTDMPLTIKQGGHYDQLSQKYFGMDKYRIFAIEKILQSNELSLEQNILAYEELKKKCKIYGNGCMKYNRIEEAKYYFNLPKKYEFIKRD